jgi:hypothetical protein
MHIDDNHFNKRPEVPSKQDGAFEVDYLYTGMPVPEEAAAPQIAVDELVNLVTELHVKVDEVRRGNKAIGKTLVEALNSSDDTTVVSKQQAQIPAPAVEAGTETAQYEIDEVSEPALRQVRRRTAPAAEPTFVAETLPPYDNDAHESDTRRTHRGQAIASLLAVAAGVTLVLGLHHDGKDSKHNSEASIKPAPAHVAKTPVKTEIESPAEVQASEPEVTDAKIIVVSSEPQKNSPLNEVIKINKKAKHHASHKAIAKKSSVPQPRTTGSTVYTHQTPAAPKTQAPSHHKQPGTSNPGGSTYESGSTAVSPTPSAATGGVSSPTSYSSSAS